MAENGTQHSQLPEQDLAGKVALITGSSRGMGRAIARHLASRGCSLICTCSGPSSIPKLDSLAETIAEQYKSNKHQAPKIVGIAADIYSPKTPAEIADCVQANFNGKINIFINNAAKMELRKPGNLSEEFVSEFLRGNVQFPIAMVEEFVKRKMFQKESKIICISSERARKVSHFATVYGATKAAAEALCRCWADAFGGKDPDYEFMLGTTANSVMAGFTETEVLAACPPELVEEAAREFTPWQAIPRRGDPEDVAKVVGLLVRPEARWMTGSVVSANGGGVYVV